MADFSDPGRNGIGSGPLAPAKPFANSFNEVDDLTTGAGAKATAEPAMVARIAEVNLAMVVVINSVEMEKYLGGGSFNYNLMKICLSFVLRFGSSENIIVNHDKIVRLYIC